MAQLPSCYTCFEVWRSVCEFQMPGPPGLCPCSLSLHVSIQPLDPRKAGKNTFTCGQLKIRCENHQREEMDISATPSPPCRHSVSLEAKSQPASAEFISTKFPKYRRPSTKLGLGCVFFFFFFACLLCAWHRVRSFNYFISQQPCEVERIVAAKILAVSAHRS